MKLLDGLCKTQADDEPLPFSQIVHINGIEDAIWCCRAEPQHDQEWRQFAIWCARHVRYLMKDPCSKLVMDVAERYVKGLASDAELTAARTTKVVANPAGAAASVAARAVMQPVAGVAVWAAACASANAAGIAAWASMVPPDSAAAWATWAAALVVIDPVQNRVRQEADAAWADVLSIVRSRQRAQFLKLVEGS